MNPDLRRDLNSEVFLTDLEAPMGGAVYGIPKLLYDRLLHVLEEAERFAEDHRDCLEIYDEWVGQKARADEAERIAALRDDAVFDADSRAGEAAGNLSAMEGRLRRDLWLGHGHHGYGDDGEMQCLECAPYGVIDYLRDPIDAVEAAFAAASGARDTALVAGERAHPICFSCRQCRVGTQDADANDCGCDGPCNWDSWEAWLDDIREQERERLRPKARQALLRALAAGAGFKARGEEITAEKLVAFVEPELAALLSTPEGPKKEIL